MSLPTDTGTLQACITQARRDRPASLAKCVDALRACGKNYAEQFRLFQQAVPDLTAPEFDELLADADDHDNAS